MQSVTEDPGLTTEFALVATPLIGAIAVKDTVLASSIGVTVAVLLAAKSTVHRFVKQTVSDAEVRDLLLFATATVVVWPLLPDRLLGPYNSLNPHKIWLFVVILLAVAELGHVLTRLLGVRYGLPLAGLTSGFVSSTATIGSMAAHAARVPAELQPAVAGAALSTVATFIQLALVLTVADRETLMAITRPLIAGGGVAFAYGLLFTLIAFRSAAAGSVENSRSAFSLGTSAALVLTLCLMLMGSAWLSASFGQSGVVIGAAIAGFLDAHSSAISVASLANSGKMTRASAVLPILAALTANSIAKAVVAAASGNLTFAKNIIPGLFLPTAAAWPASFYM